MNRKIIWSITGIGGIIIIGLSSFVILKEKSTSHQLKQSVEEMKREARLSKTAMNLYQRSLSGNYFLQKNALKLPDSSFFFTEESEKIFSKELFKKEKLIFRFSQNNCGECVNHEFELLKQYVDSIGTENLVIIGDYSENQYLEYVRQDAPKNVLCLNDNQYFRRLPFEQLNLPYFLLVGEDLSLKNLMILEKSFDQFTHSYLQMYLNQKI